MNKIRRILSMVLACVMMIALAPVVTPTEVSAAATGTTALFNGNATYLLQERFNMSWTLQANGGSSNAVLSGWDVDYRGGRVTSGSGVATLTDNTGFEKTEISHQLMKHTGDNLVMEGSFQYATSMDSGFHYTLSGAGKTALKIEVIGDTNGFFFYVNGTKTAIACAADTVYHVKAELTTSSKKATVWINGVVALTDVAYKESATSIDNVTVGTTEEQLATVKLHNVFVYVNYTVNESFIAAPLGTTPAWWETTDKIAAAPGSPYNADVNGLSLSAGGSSPESDPSAATPVKIDLPLDSISELTWKQKNVTLSVANSIGGRNNVICATGVAGDNDSTVGVILNGTNFAFQEGDVLTYSVDYYSSSTTTVEMWLRRHGGGTKTGSLQPFRAFYHSMASSANTWKTLTQTVRYEDFAGTANEATWADAGQYALYVRGGIGTCYLDNFKVTVTREVEEPDTGAGTLRKTFNALSGKQSFVWNMLVPSGGANGFSASFGGAEVTVSGGKFYLNGQEATTCRNNTWYKVEVQTNGSTADLLVNDVKYVSGISASGTMNSIMLVNGSSSNVIVDDIQVYKTFATSDYADYPTYDEVADNGDWHLGMVVYPMWYEGTHYGWDAITPYEDRTPYQGYYTGGSKEVSDWDAKWMIEHGIDHAIYPFVNPKAGEQAKMSVRGEALAGYKTGEYTDKLSFAMMMTNPLDSNLDSAADYIANAVPYIVEHNFKNPAYKVINNRLPVYMYNPDEFASLLGGNAQLHLVLDALNTEAKALGYEGIIFIADISSSSISYVDTFKTECSPSYPVYKWRYTWRTDVPGSVSTGIQYDYDTYSDVVASVPMGFDNTPWVSNQIGMMTPEEISQICSSINPGNDDPKIVLFTCWDEWGEGHFWSPSTQGGFGYLNAIRKAFTSLGEKVNETKPSNDSVLRMSVLHPEGRQILKIRDDKKTYTTDDLSGLTPLATISLQNVTASHNDTRSSIIGSWTCPGWTYGTLSGCTMTATASGASTGSGTLSTSRSHSATLSNIVYTITSPSQATVTWDVSSLGIDMSKVSAIKLNGYAQNSSEIVVNFSTDASASLSNPFVNRFCAAGDGATAAKDYILIPDDAALTGTVTRMRFNPSSSTAVGSKFVVNSVTLYQGELPTTHVYLDDVETHMVSEPVVDGNITYIPAYQFLLNAGCYVEWDKATKTLTVEKDGITALFTHEVETAIVDGEELLLNAAPYYENGNIYIAYNDILRPFDYDADKSGNSIHFYNKFWGQEYDDTDMKWDFEIDGNLDSWTTGGGVKLTAKHGLLHVRSTTSDPTIYRNNFSLSTDEYKYAVLKIKKSDVSASGLFRVYSGSNLPSTGGVVYKYSIEPSDEVQTIIFDLENDYDKSSNRSTFAELGGTITNLRMDPMDTGSTFGSIYIDSLEFTKEDPTPVPDPVYEMKAYTWGDNLIDVTGYSYWGYSNMTNNGSGWGYDSKHPPLVTVDGYSNVIELKPTGTNAEGLAQITWVRKDGANTRFEGLFGSDNLMKVSFWYKGSGDSKAIRIENRTGYQRDGEEYQMNVTDKWQYFEGYISADEATDYTDPNGNADRRYLALRAIRPSSGTGAVLLRDLQLRILNETTEVSMFTENGVAIRALKGGEAVEEGDVYITGYNGNEMTGMVKGSNPAVITAQKGITSSTGKGTSIQVCSGYHFFAPKSGTTAIKCFWWDGMDALTDPFVLD